MGITALVPRHLFLYEARDKFLLCEEASGVWELPGGGLDWGVAPQDDLPREIQEEMGIAVTWVADNPSYFITDQNLDKTLWVANVVYETTLASLDFTPSDECVQIKFVDKNDIQTLDVFGTVAQLAAQFDPANH